MKYLSKFTAILSVFVFFLIASNAAISADAQDTQNITVNTTLVSDAPEEDRIPIDQERAFNVSIADVNLLVDGKTRIKLWGIEKVSSEATVFNLKAKGQLEKKISRQPVLCTIMGYMDDTYLGQCTNQQGEDLSLYLLQSGFVSVDRPAVKATIFENPYVKAEQDAQDAAIGVWGAENRFTSSGEVQSKNFMIGAFVLMGVFILALLVIGFFVVRGFKRVVDVQNRSLDFAMKERTLKDKEKLVIASMIAAEVLENKTKIEAYLVIYEEMLQDFSDPAKDANYQKTGEIIQKQPALSRSVFDGNTYKLDLFGSDVSSKVIHYYARIKSEPDFVELAADTPFEDAKAIIDKAVSNAKKLYEISDDVIGAFTDNALFREMK